MKRATHGLVVATLLLALAASAFAAEERVEIGEFTARRIKAPTIDGKIAEGEWDKAFTTSGMMTPFGHDLHQAATTMAFGFDDEKFYFLFNCRRGDREWKLWKSVRENDGYSFGDPSIEIWVTPPTLVPETYQNVINTYPAVMDQKMIPTRGYVARGWKGDWDLGVTETDTHWVLEAAIPIKNFGFDAVKNGDVWRFLMCRTCKGARPRDQASWSITQGFSEIPQHPKVHLMDDEAVVQLLGVVSVFTGKYRFPMAVVAPDKKGAEVTVELRWHKGPVPAEGDKAESRTVRLKAGERKELEFAGTVPDGLADPKKKSYFTLSAKKKDGTLIYRQGFPFAVNGWTPQPRPARPGNAPAAKEMVLWPMYGPESSVMIARADIIDLPTREKVAGGSLRVLDPAQGNRELLRQPMGPFRNWYSTTHLFLKGVDVPLMDYAKYAAIDAENERINTANIERKKNKEKLLPLKPIPMTPPKKVIVEATVTDADGKPIKTESSELGLIRYNFVWSNNNVGVTDKVIPPWTPVQCKGSKVSVWNRTMDLDGLGLLRKIENGGVDQVRSMRLVAVQDGKEVEIKPSAPKLVRRVEAEADLEGTGAGAGLKLSAKTRVEFDGFVLSDLTIAPADAKAGAKVDKLYLEVVLPEEEATHFCTTAGGWTAVHDVTPAYWSSQQTSSGVLIGDFVPYIWLTNSDRAFMWFADNDKGWITDDDNSLPTQEIVRENGTVTLRVHFIELPTQLKAATRLTWGYQTFPKRPLPPGWRAITCSQRHGDLLGTRNTYFWFDRDANWAVLWPYYCSPYPWSLAKSAQGYSRYPKVTDHRPMVGSIAHAVARYRDYAGHEFNEYVVDWGATPGDRSNGNTTQGKGPVDFRLWHYQLWVQKGGFRGLYVDENYLGLDHNFLTGGAYIRPDGRLQAGYSYLGLREYFKRMKVMFHQNNVPPPNLWQHISSGSAYNAWFGDVFFEGENVEPTDLNFDYIEVLPAGRMRSIGSAKCAGGVMTMMCQSQRHRTVYEPKHTHQFVGWVMAHDVLPEQVPFYSIIAQEGRLYEDDVEFIGYWKEDTPLRTATPQCVVSAHKAGRHALLWIVNTARKDQTVAVDVDWKRLGFDRNRCMAVDAETGAAVKLERGGFSVGVLNRDFVAVHLADRQVLKGEESFYASFDKVAEADEAMGCRVLEDARGALLSNATLVAGVKGKALAVGKGVRFWPHLHTTDAEGRVRFHALLKEGGTGQVVSTLPKRRRRGGTPGVATICVSVSKEGVTLERLPSDRNARDGKKVTSAALGGGWHEFDLSWAGGKATLKVDGKAVGSVDVKGMNICAETGVELPCSTRFLFGGGGAALQAVDELRCYRKAE